MSKIAPQRKAGVSSKKYDSVNSSQVVSAGNKELLTSIDTTITESNKKNKTVFPQIDKPKNSK